MKPTLTRKPNSMNANVRKLVENLVMSALAEYEPGEAEAIIDKAVERFNHIEANGLKVCRHPNGELRGFVLTTLDLDPYTVGAHIDATVNEGYYVNENYYGAECDLKDIKYGFTESDIGSVFFVVESADSNRMLNHNSDIPGSILTNIRWGKERDEKFAAFAAEFATAAEIRAVNYLSHSLIQLHDLQRDLYETTLGTVGYIDYIQQFYDAEASFCPFGCVHDGRPLWNVRGARAGSGDAAVCLAR